MIERKGLISTIFYKSLLAAITAVSSILMPIQPMATNTDAEIEIAEEVQAPQTLEELIRRKADSNKLDAEKIIFIAKCESQIDPRALGDGQFTCAKTGQPMRSRGIWQINDCGHPEIADEQAFDPAWSTDWAMEIFRRGEESKEWALCSRKYKKMLQ